MSPISRNKKTITALESSIRFLIDDAEEAIQLAQESKKKALALLKYFESACANLKTQDCPFCQGIMLNTSPLKALANQLDPGGYRYGYSVEPGRFCFECQNCDTYETGEPHDWAQRWTRDDIKIGSKLFAAEVLKNFSNVDEVVLENMGRLWLFRIGQQWYGSSLEKRYLQELWKMKTKLRAK